MSTEQTINEQAFIDKLKEIVRPYMTIIPENEERILAALDAFAAEKTRELQAIFDKHIGRAMDKVGEQAEKLVAQHARIAELEREVLKWKQDAASSFYANLRLEHDQLLSQLATAEEALKKLHSDCLASDFNEHWDSYKDAEDALNASKGEGK